MAFPNDLLEQAEFLANLEPEGEASLRRAVSTAYYALFHLLIADASVHWTPAGQRPRFARLFNHGTMKTASKQVRNGTGSQARLFAVAETFITAQEKREDADYNNAKAWTRSNVLGHLKEVRKAFELWAEVRDTPEAHDYLLSLLGNPRGR